MKCKTLPPQRVNDTSAAPSTHRKRRAAARQQEYSRLSVYFVKPTLHLSNNSILEDQEGDTELAKTIKHKILEYLNDKYSDRATQELLDMASALDPRFKLKYVDEDLCEFIVDRSYFQMETLDPEDPLTWWRDTQMMFPRLSELARKYLCIPATSSSSE